MLACYDARHAFVAAARDLDPTCEQRLRQRGTIARAQAGVAVRSMT